MLFIGDPKLVGRDPKFDGKDPHLDDEGDPKLVGKDPNLDDEKDPKLVGRDPKFGEKAPNLFEEDPKSDDKSISRKSKKRGSKLLDFLQKMGDEYCSIRVLQQKMGLKDKKGFYRRYIVPSIERGLIEQLYPDTPIILSNSIGLQITEEICYPNKGISSVHPQGRFRETGSALWIPFFLSLGISKIHSENIG